MPLNAALMPALAAMNMSMATSAMRGAYWMPRTPAPCGIRQPKTITPPTLRTRLYPCAGAPE